MSKCAILDSLEFAKNKTKEGRREERKEDEEDEDGGGSSTSVRSFDPTVRNEPGDAFWTARY
jgi:hypothetical protein